MAKYALFLGCVAPARYPGVELATREVCKALGIELVELEGANCCPARTLRGIGDDAFLPS